MIIIYYRLGSGSNNSVLYVLLRDYGPQVSTTYVYRALYDVAPYCLTYCHVKCQPEGK
jgi:hypothetical protein